MTEDRLVPLHDYVRNGDNSSFSLLGISEFALYRQESSPSLFRHRLFPLYRYRHDLIKDETEFDAMFLYRHLTTPAQTADRFFPFWDYVEAPTKADWRLSLLGIESVALYRQESSPSLFQHRLFPLYRYRHDLIKDETEFDAMFSYRHLTTPVQTADRFSRSGTMSECPPRQTGVSAFSGLTQWRCIATTAMRFVYVGPLVPLLRLSQRARWRNSVQRVGATAI